MEKDSVHFSFGCRSLCRMFSMKCSFVADVFARVAVVKVKMKRDIAKMSALYTISSQIDWIKMCTILFLLILLLSLSRSFSALECDVAICATKALLCLLVHIHFAFFLSLNQFAFSAEKVYFVEKWMNKKPEQISIQKTSTLIYLASCNRNATNLIHWKLLPTISISSQCIIPSNELHITHEAKMMCFMNEWQKSDDVSISFTHSILAVIKFSQLLMKCT